MTEMKSPGQFGPHRPPVCVDPPSNSLHSIFATLLNLIRRITNLSELFELRNMSQFKLPADASRILFIRHLPDAITHDELYELFGRFGAVEQIRLYVTFAQKP